MNTAVLILSSIGFAISSYFTAINYHWVQADENWIPKFCRMKEQTCASIVFTPRARVFGIPNSLLGQVFYLSLIISVVLGYITHPVLFPLLLGASLTTVGLGAYLSYSLLFITRIPCTLCFTSHIINAVIFGLLLL